MADRLEPVGFWSYATLDDKSSGGHLSTLRRKLADALQLKIGRQPVQIFQDVAAIPLGSEWASEIDRAINASCFLIPIITPGFLQSEWCCKEVVQFRARERLLGRADLIFPFYYIDPGHIDPDDPRDCHDKSVYELVRARQGFDFHAFLHEPVDAPDVRRQIARLADAIYAALRRADVSASTVSTPSAAASPPPPGLSAPSVVTAHAATDIQAIPDAPEMVLIPKGSFIMGVPAGEEERENYPATLRGWGMPRKRITFDKPFWMGKFPVTRYQFATFIAETGYVMPDEAWTYEPDKKGKWTYEKRNGQGWRQPGFDQTDSHPVVCVSVADAEAYLKWLSEKAGGPPFRLPSEAEWEYACRAKTVTARFWGDDRAGAARYAKVRDRALMAKMKTTFDPEVFFDFDSGLPFMAPVGTFSPNNYGLHDMLGNVWEWTADVWADSLKNIPDDGKPNTTGDSSRRAMRGAPWNGNPAVVRAGARHWSNTGVRDSGTGFRVARTSF